MMDDDAHTIYLLQQGCGHIRHMMEEPEEYGLEGEYEAEISAALIKSFFTLGWKSKWDVRSKLYLPILQGTLNGNATVIINKADKAACPGLYPETGRAHGGSQMFIYQPDVSLSLRRVIKLLSDDMTKLYTVRVYFTDFNHIFGII